MRSCYKVLSASFQINKERKKNLLVILMTLPEEFHPHHHGMTHCQSCLVKTVVWSCLVEQSHGKETVENWIHNPPSPPLHELMTGLSGPEPQSIIVVQVICHVVALMDELINRIPPFISRVDFVGIHTFPNL